MSVADTAGNTWTVDVQAIYSGGPSCAIIRSVLSADLAVNDTITVTLSNASAYNTAAVICEYEGAYDTVDVTYDVAGTSDVTSVTVTAGSATGQAGELVVAGIGIGGTPTQSGSFTIGSSTPAVTLRAQSPDSPGENNTAIADGTAAATVTPSVSWSWSDSDVPVAVIATYVTPGGGGTAVPVSRALAPSLVAAGIV